MCRPFDDQSFLRIRLETDAYYLIVEHIESGSYQLIVSAVHQVELDDFKNVSEREKVAAILRSLGNVPQVDLKRARQKTEALIAFGLGMADAAHLSFAEQSADFLITCDDEFLKKARKLDLRIEVISPIEFCVKENLK